MKRAYSVANVITASFDLLPFDGEWEAAVGHPERAGSWLIYGPVKTGKTSFAMQLTKYLTRFERVLYVSAEEGLSRSIQLAYQRVHMEEVAGRVVLVGDLDFEELTDRLKRKRSPNIVIIDTIQYSGLGVREYKLLRKKYPHKLFIFISHVKSKGRLDGATADRIKKYAGVVFQVDCFRAFPTSRYGGSGQYIDVNAQKAAEHWVNE